MSAAQPKRLINYLFVITAILMLFAVIFGLKWYQKKQSHKKGTSRSGPVMVISTAKSRTIQWDEKLESVGSFVAQKSVGVSPQVAGKVARIAFQSGGEVKKGQLLVQLDDRADMQQLNFYLAQMNLAKLTYKRRQLTYDQGGVSRQDLDSAKASYQQALAQVKKQQALIEYKHIRAPFSGQIGIRQVNLGQYLNPGDTVAKLVSLSPIYFDFNLPQQHFDQVHMGQIVTIKPEGHSQSISGHVTAKSPAISKDSRSFIIRATFKNAKKTLQPGVFSHVTLYSGHSKSVVVVPNTAIVYSLSGNQLYTLQPMKSSGPHKLYRIHAIVVTVGERVGDDVIITSPLKAGLNFVSVGQMKVYEGAVVTINNTNTVTPKKDSKMRGA